MRNVVGIDIGVERFAFAEINSGVLIKSGYIQRRENQYSKKISPDYPSELRAFVKARSLYEDDPLIAVEGAYKHRNIRTFASLHAVISEIEFVCLMYRVPCVVVQPREWQPFMFPNVKHVNEVLKAASIKSANAFAKVGGLTEHECDAINIARYARQAYEDYYG